MKKKNLLIIQQHQFGYLTDSYKWCEYLNKDYNITILCYDAGKPKISLSGIDINYFNIKGNRYTRGIRFIIYCLYYILKKRGITIVIYFEKCELLKSFLFSKKMILDIRTLSVHNSESKRDNFNAKLKKACNKFDLITVISKGVKNQINLPNKDIRILPLGGDTISTKVKSFENIKLLYVGTLSNRHIEKTIDGLHLFTNRFPNCNISYDIVGDGNENELEELIKYTQEKGEDFNSKIRFWGRVPYNKLKPFFDKCNIGISFIPMTDYFDAQPPTKTYEYILSGLYTIATETTSNKEIITHENGILIKDTPQDFADALSVLFTQKEKIRDEVIRNSLKESTWKAITQNYLKPILNKF